MIFIQAVILFAYRWIDYGRHDERLGKACMCKCRVYRVGSAYRRARFCMALLEGNSWSEEKLLGLAYVRE